MVSNVSGTQGTAQANQVLRHNADGTATLIFKAGKLN